MGTAVEEGRGEKKRIIDVYRAQKGGEKKENKQFPRWKKRRRDPPTTT